MIDPSRKTQTQYRSTRMRVQAVESDHIPGWYKLCGKFQAFDGRRVRLVLRIIIPEGLDEPRLVPVASFDGTGCVSSVVVLTGAINEVWLETVDGGPPPEFEFVKLQRISRARAMLRMLRSIGSIGGWALMAHTAIAMLIAALHAGVRGSGELLAGQYFQQIRRQLKTEPTAPATLRAQSWSPLVMTMELHPIRHLEVVAELDGNCNWGAIGDDPGFWLGLEKPEPLQAGWYRLRCRIEESTGHIIQPCLYCDYGPENGEALIPLPEPTPEGDIDALVLIKYSTRVLRFDPSIRRAQFIVHSFDLRRIGRIGAVVAMLTALRAADGRRDWRAIGTAIGQFASTTHRCGLSTAAAELFSRYCVAPIDAALGYTEWVRRFDTQGEADLPVLERRASRVTSGPLVSLLVPVYQTPERWLRRCLESVLAQAYPNWELCIAEDASPSERVREVLREYELSDPRIRVTYRQENGHIAQASNTALAMARGEYVGLLDHDDELRPHALLEVVEAITAHPGLEFIYSDEDKIDESGNRFHPNFKPNWNPDLLLSQNYVCHFSVIRTKLARSAGGFRTGFEGSQDHDLFLRCTRQLHPEQIHHVPKVLYHWRATVGSTALERSAKDYASSAGARAVSEHVQALDPRARVEELPHGHYRVHWPLPVHAPKVSLIIPTRDRAGLLRTCVESVIQRTRYSHYELVVVDNQSSEPDALAYLEELRGHVGVKVLSYNAPFNYSAINNWAARQCDGELLCLLNNDIEVISEDWLEEMARHALRPEIGAVGAMLYYPDRSIQHAGVILGLGGVANHAYLHQPEGYPGHGARALVAQNLSAVTGACLMVRAKVYEQVGGLDERLQVAFNDIDFCLRLCEAGYRNLWTPFARLYHHESASRGIDDSVEKRERFLGEVTHMECRWADQLKNDPAYNPNLSLDDTNFGFAFPPRTAS